ncbi:MAG TPA: DoxX family protein [Longimicrobiaceae bacterium]|nr:DoxX family protein [Longimicrobiaceae bacterium]
MPLADAGRKERLRAVSRVLLAALFVVAGALHFTATDFYLRIMPPYVPFHRAAVFGSGVLEIIGGIALLVPRLRRWAAAGLVLLLAAVFPANVHMALHPEQFPDVAPLLLWLRLPLQPMLMAWLWWAAGAGDA